MPWIPDRIDLKRKRGKAFLAFHRRSLANCFHWKTFRSTFYFWKHRIASDFHLLSRVWKWLGNITRTLIIQIRRQKQTISFSIVVSHVGLFHPIEIPAPNISTPFSPKNELSARLKRVPDEKLYWGVSNAGLMTFGGGLEKGKAASNIFANCRVWRGSAKLSRGGWKNQSCRSPFLVHCHVFRMSASVSPLLHFAHFYAFPDNLLTAVSLGLFGGCFKLGRRHLAADFQNTSFGVLWGCFEVSETFRH